MWAATCALTFLPPAYLKSIAIAIAISAPRMTQTPNVHLAPRLCWLAIFLLVLSEASPGQPPANSASESLQSVTVCQVRSGESKSSFQLLGTVTPSRTTTIGYALPGRLKTLHVRRGDRLSAGDAIADLATDVVKIELAAAKAQLDLVQHQLAELEAGSRSEDIAEAKARMSAAAAIARRNASQLNRIKKLVQSRAASVDEVDVATAEADSSKQLLEAATIAHARLVAGPRSEQVAQAKARVDLQREQVRLLEDRLKKHTVIAPFDGYVTTEFTEAGAWITAGDPVVGMIELNSVQVEVAVPAQQIVDLRLGQSIRVQCNQRPDELLLGQLERIVPAADTRARTFPVLVRIQNRIENGIPMLMSGMVVRIDLPIGPEQQLTFVPTDAIVLDGNEQSVFVIDGDGSAPAPQQPAKVRKVQVKLGVAEEGWIAVTGDLDPQTWVVTKGNERLSSDQTVEATVSDG